MEELNRVAKKVESFPGIAERMGLLAQGFLLAEPMLNPQGPAINIFHRSIPDIPHTNIKFLPWFSGDEEILGRINAALVRPIGMYLWSFNAVILNMEADNATAMAHICFHEFGHALASRKKGIVLTNKVITFEEEAEEELEMRTFDSNLMLMLGGDEYKARLEHNVQLVLKTRQQRGIGLGGFHWHEATELEMDGVFDAVYGPPPNARAKRTRGETFQLYCQLLAADRMFRRQQAKAFKVSFFKYFRDNAQGLI